MPSADRARQVPVVIAGAGPAGLVAAVTLARNGIASLLVERNPGLSPLPRATSVSTRTMELLRSWGLEAEVRAGQLAITAVGAWAAQTLASPDGTLMPLGHPDLEQAAAASPTMLAGVPQDHLEPVLLRHLGTFGLTEVCFGTELIALDQDADSVTVELRQRATGERRTVRAGYLVGADGAHSRTRGLLGIAMDGPDHLDEQLTVLFEAPLGEVVGDRRYGIYFIQHPEAGGVFVPNGGGDRWLYGRGWEPEHERLEDYTDARLAGLIRTAAGDAGLPVRVVAKGAFSFAAQVAGRYREGRAFLVGDAAQRMTPRGGMGMNTAVAEGHDLGWKLAWVLHGWAGPDLLDTYEAEWRPVGTRRAARSADPGPEASGVDALAEDLNGRLPHVWLPRRNGRPLSTLDLLGRGLTLLTGPDPAPWTAATATLDPAVPLDLHTLDHRTAATLDIDRDGALLVRPDARVITHWPTAATDPQAELSEAVSSWFGRPPVSSGAGTGRWRRGAQHADRGAAVGGLLAPGAPGVHDGVVGVGQEGEAQAVLVAEPLVAGGVVGGDADHRDAGGLEAGQVVARLR